MMNELHPTGKDAKQYFNEKYSSRKDLGNKGGDDGYLFRGFGPIQVTGRENFEKISKMIDEPNLATDPESFRDMKQAKNLEVALKVSAAFWKMKGLNELCESCGMEDKDVEKVT